MRGIADIKVGYVCVGSSVGKVVILSTPSPDGEAIDLQQTIETSASPITALAASDTLLVCGNEAGDVFAFDVAAAFEQKCKIPGYNFPITAICTRGETITATFTSGHIRLYSARYGEMKVEVTAHLRCITAAALHSHLNLVATVSDDQFLHVWHVPDLASRSQHDLELIYSDKVENRLLTGVAFLGEDQIGVTAFDEEDLIVFRGEK